MGSPPPRDTELAIFAYGSLVDRRSAAATLGRPVEDSVPASLRGWVRRFSQARRNRECEKTFARADDGSVPEVVLGLNLERADAGGGDASSSSAPRAGPETPNGVLIPVSPRELERLDRREIRYQRCEITGAVELGREAWQPERVLTFVARPENLAPEPPPGAVILRSYAEAVERAFAALGDEGLERYRRTTLPYPTEVVDGMLIADRIPPGNPREW